MTTWLILLAGIAVVVGGIIWLRIHAFVALVLGALVVAVLTPSFAVQRSSVMKVATDVVAVSASESAIAIDRDGSDGNQYVVLLDRGPGMPLQPMGSIAAGSLELTGDRLPVSEQELPPGTHWYALDLQERADPLTTSDDSSARPVQALQDPERLLLVTKAQWRAAQELSSAPPIGRITLALGNTCGKLAILIVAASIIGACLLESGAADRIVRASLAVFTERFAPLAFTVAGFILAIPVFFDTVFLLMIPLGKSMCRRTGRNYLLYVLSILVGATMAHSLVPPTPGPLLIANELNLSVLQMAMGGCVVGGCGAMGGLLFAVLVNRRTTLPVRDPDLLDNHEKHDQPLPALWESLLPIVIPIGLIAAETQADKMVSGIAGVSPEFRATVRAVFATVGNKSVALLIGAALAAITFRRVRRPTLDVFQRTMNAAVLSAGAIVLVTSAGSAFGQMLQQTSIAESLARLPGSSPFTIVLAAFLVTTLVRTAQGSATVAMITSAGVFAPLVATGMVDVHPLYVALAIGCGSKPLSWMNDSGFLVITRTSGMTDAEGLKYVTTTMAVAALVGLAVIVAGVIWFPDLPTVLPS